MNQELYSFSQQLDWISQDTNCFINLEDLAGITFKIPKLILRRDQYYHQGPYCEFAKLNGNQPNCANNKTLSIQKALKQEKSFSGYCPFGVWDHAQPVYFDKQCICIIYAGGLKGKQKLESINSISFQENKIKEITSSQQKQIKEACLFIKKSILYILKNWISEGNTLNKKKSADFYYQAVSSYIQNHYHKNISIQSIASLLNTHPNHLSNILKNNSKSSFNQLLKQHRIKKAKILLMTENLNVTQVAYACGFQDGNYFSTVFKSVVGTTPKKFQSKKK
ncbi:MAG: hypothetical protein COA79_04990 [Planctomycetota bacterium]|nr:MAG: hypothetical protein COA79_04990 [Planctomycetota bacterium]